MIPTHNTYNTLRCYSFALHVFVTYDGTLHHRNALWTCRFSPQSSHRWSWRCILHYLVLYTHRYHHTPKENVGIRKCTHTQSYTEHPFAGHSGCASKYQWKMVLFLKMSELCVTTYDVHTVWSLHFFNALGNIILSPIHQWHTCLCVCA